MQVDGFGYCFVFIYFFSVKQDKIHINNKAVVQNFEINSTNFISYFHIIDIWTTLINAKFISLTWIDTIILLALQLSIDLESDDYLRYLCSIKMYI